MAQTKEVTINEKTYKIASLLTREVEDLILGDVDKITVRDRVVVHPRLVVLAGLNNAEPETRYTSDDVLALPWPVFKKLQEEILEFTGFSKPKVTQGETKSGESKAVVN